MKDPKDILRIAKANTNGLSPDDIIFSDVRKKKIKKECQKKYAEEASIDKIIGNDEGFSLISEGVEFCSYDKIGKKRRTVKGRSLEEWGAFDFFYYVDKKFVETYGKPMGLRVGGNSLEINKIRDKFSNLFGFCCNLIMKDYIDFFFDKYLNFYMKKEKGFFFKQMRNDKIISEFYEHYDFKKSFLRYSSKCNSANGERNSAAYNISEKSINDSYMISDTSLVSNYGIVISLNWLMNNKRKTASQAAALVLKACKELHSKNMIEVVKNSTEKYSPYSSSLSFKSPHLVMSKIDKNISLNVEFKDENKDRYAFLTNRK